MDIANKITIYEIDQKNISDLGDLTTIVKISREPIFENTKSIEVRYHTNFGFNSNPEYKLTAIDIEKDNSILGTTTISYKKIKAEEYSGKISVEVVLGKSIPGNKINVYAISRKNTIKLLPQIIAQYEKENPKE